MRKARSAHARLDRGVEACAKPHVNLHRQALIKRFQEATMRGTDQQDRSNCSELCCPVVTKASTVRFDRCRMTRKRWRWWRQSMIHLGSQGKCCWTTRIFPDRMIVLQKRC